MTKSDFNIRVKKFLDSNEMLECVAFVCKSTKLPLISGKRFVENIYKPSAGIAIKQDPYKWLLKQAKDNLRKYVEPTTKENWKQKSLKA